MTREQPRVAWWGGWIPLAKPYGEALHYLESTRALLAAGVDGRWVLSGRETAEDLAELADFGVPTEEPRFPFPPRRACRLTGLPPFTWMWGSADILHSWRADYVPGFSGPMVLTVLDAIPDGEDGGIQPVLRPARAAARRASAVLTSTRATIGSLENMLGVAPGRVTVVGAGVDLEAFQPGPLPSDAAVLARHALSPGYVLYTGGWVPRKGLDVLTRAYESIDRADRPRLVMTGRPGPPFAGTATALEAAGARLVGYVDAADVPALTRCCAAVVMPSLAEGFGLPVLQAMACGRPVIASDLPVVREVSGGLVRLVRPGDVAVLAAALREAPGLMADPAALPRARGQSWAEGAALIAGVYRHLS